jgi:hypothetical protein
MMDDCGIELDEGPLEAENHGSRGAKVRLRPSLLATVAGLCLAAGTGRAQYVEDSIDVGGAWVGSLVYNSREDAVLGASAQGSPWSLTSD